MVSHLCFWERTGMAESPGTSIVAVCSWRQQCPSCWRAHSNWLSRAAWCCPSSLLEGMFPPAFSFLSMGNGNLLQHCFLAMCQVKRGSTLHMSLCFCSWTYRGCFQVLKTSRRTEVSKAVVAIIVQWLGKDSRGSFVILKCTWSYLSCWYVF